MPTILARCPLGYSRGTSDKVYIVDLLHTGNDRFEVACHYGPRDKELLQISPQGVTTNMQDALSVFAKAVQGKLKKGYERVGARACDSIAFLAKEKVKSLDVIGPQLLQQFKAGKFKSVPSDVPEVDLSDYEKDEQKPVRKIIGF